MTGLCVQREVTIGAHPRRKDDGTVLSPESDAFKRIKEEALRAATEEEEASHGTRTQLLASVCFLEMMANFDAGVLPATIGHVMCAASASFRVSTHSPAHAPARSTHSPAPESEQVTEQSQMQWCRVLRPTNRRRRAAERARLCSHQVRVRLEL